MKQKPTIKTFQASRPEKSTLLTLTQVKQRLNDARRVVIWAEWSPQVVVRN